MDEVIAVDIKNKGQWGVRLTTTGNKPRNCPGAGGWKSCRESIQRQNRVGQDR